MMSLIGYGERWLIGFPAVQASILAVAACCPPCCSRTEPQHGSTGSFAESFGASGAACVIEPALLAQGAAAVLLLSLLPATLIGVSFTRVDPSDEIRDV